MLDVATHQTVGRLKDEPRTYVGHAVKKYRWQ